MNGLALAERVAERHPRTRVLYISGYSATMVARQGIANPQDIALLQKPFTVSALTAKVREVLDAPA
jgi:two-component system cell cycle sensor histidine kinase/response regulator CckA